MTCCMYSRQRCNLFVYSAIAIPQLGGSTCAIAIQQLLKEMLLRNFAIAIFLKSATSSLQLDSFTTAIFGIFLAVDFGQFMKNKIKGKKILCYLPFKASFWFPKKQTVLNKFLVDF